jgi:PKD repeat protein
VVIPAETFPAEDQTYWLALTVENMSSGHPGEGETSQASSAVTVGDGTVTLDFHWIPTSPEIGETVTFTVDEQWTPSSWNFGGLNCNGDGPFVDCTASPALCRNITWRYASAGAKTVTLVAEEGTVQKTLTVQNSGSCFDPIFSDGFESGDTSMWSVTMP